MFTTRPKIVIRFLTQLEESKGDSLNAARREAFWDPIRQLEQSGSERLPQNDAILENRLVNNFGSKLRDELIKHVAEQGDPSKLTVARTVLFKAEGIHYSSLDLGLYIGAVEKLGQIFDSNFDLFLMFLDIYAPIAFASALGIDPLPDLVRSELQEAPDSIRNEFEKSGGTNTMIGREQLAALRKREWLSGIANASLAIPFALALAVTYFAFKELSTLRAEQKNLYQPIIEQQMNLLKEDRERLQQLFERVNPKETSEVSVTNRSRKTRLRRRR